MIYSITYTVYNPTNLNETPVHKKYTFESENDLLAAADEGMCRIYDQYGNEQNQTDVLFRGVTLDNAQEVYKQIKEEASNAKPTTN